MCEFVTFSYNCNKKTVIKLHVARAKQEIYTDYSDELLVVFDEESTDGNDDW